MTKNVIQKDFLRVKELAKKLGLNKSTIWSYVKQGKIKSKKISPRVVFFDYEEVKKDLGLV